MKSRYDIFKPRISTKLMAINGLITYVIIIITLLVFMSFNQTKSLMRGVINEDMNKVMSNILTERELRSILLDINHLINTFSSNDIFLNTEGNRLITFMYILVNRNLDTNLEKPLRTITKKIGFILLGCKDINRVLRRIRLNDTEILEEFSALEHTILEHRTQIINKGQNTKKLDDVTVLVQRAKLNFLEIGKMYAETWTKNYNATSRNSNTIIFHSIDTVNKKLKNIIGPQRLISEKTDNIITLLHSYKRNLYHLQNGTSNLQKRIQELKIEEDKAITIIENLDRDLILATQSAEKKISQKVQFTKYALLAITITLTIALTIITAFFLKKIIRNPMNLILKGIEEFRSGNLNNKITINRDDEWLLIETALNSMANDLSVSYDALQLNHDQLEKKVAERTTELLIANKDALQAQQTAETANQAKSEFLARMSHEIRTPLNAVIGLTRIVLNSELTSPQRDYLNKVQLASNNLLEVINDILDFSKIEADRLELTHTPFDLKEIIEQLSDIFGTRVEDKDIELIFIIDPQLETNLIGDPARLKQVLINLIENAIKFTHGGTVVIKARPNPKLIKAEDVHKTSILFSVLDTGIGIRDDEFKMLFEPFSQVDSSLTRNHEGSGLGLAICKKLVELMDGQIHAESSFGNGSKFIFTITCDTQPAHDKSSLEKPNNTSFKVLIADDNKESMQSIATQLETCGADIIKTDKGNEVIRLLELPPTDDHFNIILLDWKMGTTFGLDIAKSIRNNPSFSTIPIILMMTAYGIANSNNEDIGSWTDYLLHKPVKPSELSKAIHNLLSIEEGVSNQNRQDPTEVTTTKLENARILVVEDSELNRAVTTHLLEEAGIEVDVAANGLIAVEKVITSQEGGYDLILMDIQMPIMDGYEATNKIRKSNSPLCHIPIIALTAHVLQSEREKCFASGMNDYLSKPIDEHHLLHTITKWVSRKSKKKGYKLTSQNHSSSNFSEILDTTLAIKLLGGKTSLYKNSLRIFIKQYHQTNKSLTKKDSPNNDETILKIVHGLKSNAAQIGAHKLSELSEQIEHRYRNNIENKDNLIPPLLQELETTILAAKQYLSKK